LADVRREISGGAVRKQEQRQTLAAIWPEPTAADRTPQSPGQADDAQPDAGVWDGPHLRAKEGWEQLATGQSDCTEYSRVGVGRLRRVDSNYLAGHHHRHDEPSQTLLAHTVTVASAADSPWDYSPERANRLHMVGGILTHGIASRP
jgi:hypothetical protein